MKNLKYNIGIFLSLALLFSSCQEDDFTVGDIVTPSGIQITAKYIDDGVESTAPGLGSGNVEFSATADNAISFQYIYNGNTTSAPGGKQSYSFAVLGLNTYSITVLAFGTGGASSSKTFAIEVLSLYEPPADLLTMLHANSSRIWRIEAEQNGHFGLGPPAGFTPGEWFSAGADSKAGVGMYEDRYIFNADGTFTHITDSTNDNPTVDVTGTVFGRIPLINELGGPGGGTEDGADALNYPFDDYSEQWILTAPEEVETITLTGLGFIGYYTGGNHKYRIFSREPNKMILSTLDGNGEFEWWLTLVPE